MLIKIREMGEIRENPKKMERRINIKKVSRLNRRVQIHPETKVNLVDFYVLVLIDFEIALKGIG